MKRILFCHCMYSQEITLAARELTSTDQVECFFENNTKKPAKYIKDLQPAIIVSHMASPVDVSEIKGVDAFVFSLGLSLKLVPYLKQVKEKGLVIPNLIVIAALDNTNSPLNFWEETDVVSNYIMPPKSHWDVYLAVRQALHRKIENIDLPDTLASTV